MSGLKAAKTRAYSKKHAGTAKHHAKAKHTPTAHKGAASAHGQRSHRVKLTAKAAKARAWSPDSDVALCSARAVAESLRLALGVPVSDADVLALYWLVSDDPDAGASILATLDAAARGGLAELRPVFAECPLDDLSLPFGQLSRHRLEPDLGEVDHGIGVGVIHGLILGLDLPYGEPHAVVAHQGAWWSWGEPYDPAEFPDAVIEEAWAVQWQ